MVTFFPRVRSVQSFLRATDRLQGLLRAYAESFERSIRYSFDYTKKRVDKKAQSVSGGAEPRGRQ